MNPNQTLAGNPYATFGYSVADAQPTERAAFVRRTYTHLAAAVYAFAALEWFYFRSGIAERFIDLVAGAPWGMLVVFALFMGVSWVANNWARSEASPGLQYAGLFGFVVAESIVFVPILWFAQSKTLELAGQEVNVIGAAGMATLAIFGALTAAAWLSRKDFSFLGAGLGIAGVGVFVLLLASYLLGFHMGIWFSVAMVAFAAAYILYDTSNAMHHYRPDQHVAASLALFASVALLFFYLLRLFSALSNRE